MKSITVTTHRAINYGGVLQAYALQQFLLGKGIENELLHLPKIASHYRKIDTSSMRRFLFSIYYNINSFIFSRDGLEVEKKFDEFVEQHLKTTRLYKDKDDLYKDPPLADFYLTGSDQVFSVRHKQAYARMLGFVKNGIPKYSYAASLGEYDWTDDEKEQIKTALASFTDISVREAYAKEYLEGICNKEIHVNLDPVFLIDPEKFKDITVEPHIEEPYILVYPLISNPAIQELIDKAKKELGYKTVSVRVSRKIKYKCDEYVYTAGPKEFLGLIKNAKAVITTSFHGAALSIIFNKPFYVLIKDFKSQRITDLLTLFQFNDRLYDDDKKLNFDVDFRYANKLIASEREKSNAYVQMILDHVNGKK